MKVRDMVGGGRELGTSQWLTIDQARIDEFARASGDHQWIHVDPRRASVGPFGRTIAHGFLVSSLVPLLLEDVLHLEDQSMGVNYGVNRIRFTSPVPVDSSIRLRASVTSGEPRGDGVLAVLDVEVEIAGVDRPALVGEFLLLAYD